VRPLYLQDAADAVAHHLMGRAMNTTNLQLHHRLTEHVREMVALLPAWAEHRKRSRRMKVRMRHRPLHRVLRDVKVTMPPLTELLATVERTQLQAALDASRTQVEAAQLLQITPRSVAHRMKKHGLTHTRANIP